MCFAFSEKYRIDMPLERRSRLSGRRTGLSIFGVDIASGSPGSRRLPATHW